MAKQGYRIQVRRDGSIKIEADGFVGMKCQDELKKLQKEMAELGINASIVDQQKKSEMYATPVTGTEVTY